MNQGYLKDQQDQVIVNEPFAFYSYISSPSFHGFETLPDTSKFVLDPFVREVMLANLRDVQVKLAMIYYDIIDDCHRVQDMDLSPTANTYSRKLLRLVIISMGTEQAFLKTMLTNYSISETRTEERAYQELKEAKQEDKESKWKFLPKGGRLG